MIGLYCSSAIVFVDLYCSLKNMPIDSIPTTELLTVAEVAGLLKISVSTVRRLQQRRLIPFHKVGGSVRFTKDDLMSYLEKQRVEAIG
jgi:excisionase family DNA binding protein